MGRARPSRETPPFPPCPRIAAPQQTRTHGVPRAASVRGGEGDQAWGGPVCWRPRGRSFSPTRRRRRRRPPPQLTSKAERRNPQVLVPRIFGGKQGLEPGRRHPDSLRSSARAPPPASYPRGGGGGQWHASHRQAGRGGTYRPTPPMPDHMAGTSSGGVIT